MNALISIYFHPIPSSIHTYKNNQLDTYLQKQSVGEPLLTLRTAVFAHHFSAADHQPDLVDIHQFLLDFSAAPHLSLLLQISCPLDLDRIHFRLSNCVGAHCAPHPNSHGLKSDQLPVRQTLYPAHKSVVDFHLWHINRIRRL